MTSPAELAAVAREWWEYQRRSVGTRDERKALAAGQPETAQAARDFVDRAVQGGGRNAIDVLLALVDATPEGDDGVAVGAGPLEDLVHEHGDELAEEIELSARRHPSFAASLAVVWVERGHLSSATEARLKPWIAGYTNS